MPKAEAMSTADRAATPSALKSSRAFSRMRDLVLSEVVRLRDAVFD
jgi:hypothetical protein